jgi:hypothetical protein
MEHDPAEKMIHTALDDLLQVVDRSANDLRAFHTTVSRARFDQLAPFPRASLALTTRVIDHLKTVEQDLWEVLTALGLNPSEP